MPRSTKRAIPNESIETNAKEKLRKRQKTVLRKLAELKKLCDMDSYLLLRKGNDIFTYQTDKESGWPFSDSHLKSTSLPTPDLDCSFERVQLPLSPPQAKRHVVADSTKYNQPCQHKEQMGDFQGRWNSLKPPQLEKSPTEKPVFGSRI